MVMDKFYSAIKVILVFAIFAGSSVAYAGKYRMMVDNQCGKTMDVMFIARGCAGVSHGQTLVCHTYSVANGNSQTYDFTHGTSQQWFKAVDPADTDKAVSGTRKTDGSSAYDNYTLAQKEGVCTAVYNGGGHY